MTRLLPLQHWGSTTEEIDAPMPGDDIIAGSAAEGTRSITINARSATIFDFISQMGFGRAGWYSYDLLDNLGRRSADTIHPEWLVDTAGENVPGGPVAFVAAVVERPTAYVLQVPHSSALGHSMDFTLAYKLDEDPAGPSTRVTTRVRIAIDGPTGPAIEKAMLFGDGVMVQKQLRGIKERAEAIYMICTG